MRAGADCLSSEVRAVASKCKNTARPQVARPFTPASESCFCFLGAEEKQLSGARTKTVRKERRREFCTDVEASQSTRFRAKKGERREKKGRAPKGNRTVIRGGKKIKLRRIVGGSRPPGICNPPPKKTKNNSPDGQDGIRTRAPYEIGALIQRLRPTRPRNLEHETSLPKWRLYKV